MPDPRKCKKCTKLNFGWGSLQRSPRPPSWINSGLFLRGGEGIGREGEERGGEGEWREERGREGEERGEGDGKGGNGKGMGSLGQGRNETPPLHAPLIHISGYGPGSDTYGFRYSRVDGMALFVALNTADTAIIPLEMTACQLVVHCHICWFTVNKCRIYDQRQRVRAPACSDAKDWSRVGKVG